MGIEKAVQNFVKRAEESNLQLEGVAVADEKHVIAEHRFTPDRPRNIYSNTKSFTAAAVGMAVDEGKLKLDDRLADFFPEYVPKNADPRLLQIRLRDLLTMSSGFGQGYLMAHYHTGIDDCMEYMMSRAVIAEPGSKFVYSNGDTYLAGRMAEKAVGERVDTYLHDRLFSPLKICWAMEHDIQGHVFGASGLYLGLRDMLKLGQLYLADGVWNGRRILSHEWIAESSSKHIETGIDESIDASFGYGYQMWMCPYPGSFRADGAYGQLTIVLPQQGLLVAIQCPEIDYNIDRVRPVLYYELIEEIISG